MDEQFYEGSEDFKMRVSGEYQVWWCHVCDCYMTIAVRRKAILMSDPIRKLKLITGGLLSMLYTCSPC